MVDEWDDLERRILQVAPTLEPSVHDRMLYEAGVAAERSAGRRRLWGASAGSAMAAVAATWLLATFVAPAGAVRGVDAPPQLVQAPTRTAADEPSAGSPAKAGAANRESVVEETNSILTASGLASLPSGRPIATNWNEHPETSAAIVGEEQVWRAGKIVREWGY